MGADSKHTEGGKQASVQASVLNVGDLKAGGEQL